MWPAPSKEKEAAATLLAGLRVWRIVGESPPFVAIENQNTGGDGSLSFSNEVVNTPEKNAETSKVLLHGKGSEHYSTVTKIVKRIWLPLRVPVIVSFGSNLSNLLLFNFHRTIPEIAFHFSLFYSTVLRGKGNFIPNPCLSPWPRNSCIHGVIPLAQRIWVNFVISIASLKGTDVNALHCRSLSNLHPCHIQPETQVHNK